MTLLNKHLLNGAQGVWLWTMGLQTDQKKIWNSKVYYTQFLNPGRIRGMPWGATRKG